MFIESISGNSTMPSSYLVVYSRHCIEVGGVRVNLDGWRSVSEAALIKQAESLGSLLQLPN